jgi:Lrp/AsnC family transcriptional regulator for asnA, asnC and gidA
LPESTWRTDASSIEEDITGGGKGMKIDDVDFRILDILTENGRTPNNEIAAKLSISEGTVRNRIRKLTGNDILKVRGLANPDGATEKQLIYILVTLEMTKRWKEIAQKVSELPGVKSVSMVTGRFDLIVELFIEPHNLITFLTEDLGNVGDISSTESLVTIKNYKKWV